MIKIWKTFRFEAAHHLPKTPLTHKCHNIHGHNFAVTMSFVGPVNDDGWLIDFSVIADAWEPIKAQIDHRMLNDIAGLENPTSENIAIWVWNQMITKIPFLSSVEVQENENCGAIYCG